MDTDDNNYHQQCCSSGLIVEIHRNLLFQQFEVPNLDPQSITAQVLQAASYVFAIIFFLEMVAKIILYGLIKGKTAYLRDGWNVLDAIITVVGHV